MIFRDIDVNWSYDEYIKHFPENYETTSFGCSYPRVAPLNYRPHIWIDFERDLSKIRHIEEEGKFGERIVLYEKRFGFIL